MHRPTVHSHFKYCSYSTVVYPSCTVSSRAISHQKRDRNSELTGSEGGGVLIDDSVENVRWTIQYWYEYSTCDFSFSGLFYSFAKWPFFLQEQYSYARTSDLCRDIFF